MKRILSVIVVVATSLLSFHSQSQEKDPSRWTPEDVIHTEYMRSVTISPDETMVVWTKQKPVKSKDRFVSDIYLTRLNVRDDKGFKTIQLTNAEDNDYSPFFSKDGEYIYFLSSRDKGNKLWKLSIYGGEPIKVHEFKNGISNIQWQNDHTFLYQSTEGATLYEEEANKLKDNVIVVEDSLHWKPSRVFAFDMKKNVSTRITTNQKPLAGYEVSPDGNWLVYRMQRSRSYASDQQHDPFVYLQHIPSGKVQQIITDRGYPSYGFQFTEDSQGFYFSSENGSDPEWNGSGVNELYYYTIATQNYQKVPLDWDLGIGRGYEVVGNDVLVTLANKAKYQLAYYTKKGTSWTKSTKLNLGAKNNHTAILDISKKGTKAVYQYSTASKLPVFYVADFKKNQFQNEQELVRLNQKLAKKSITKSEVITWKGYNDEEVTGILYYPENYEAGKQYPLMLSIHGGPAAADTDTWSERWSTYPNILAQRGAFVLKPNYHGSSNHGLAYVEAIKGNYYEPEMEDIYKGIQYLNEKGMIDMTMLGTMGWSNGAILTTMLTLRYPDLFKVAAPGAGDVNWTSDFGTCSFGVSFDQSYFGGAPWDDMNGTFYNENYIKKSPIFEIEKIKTPTIIFHGSEDRSVPRDQGWEYYRGLQQVGIAPVRFLWFPGQPHGLGKITHQLRKMKEELRWIDTYLFKKEDTTNAAFKKESPLASLLSFEKAATVENGALGVLTNNVLVPETAAVAKDSIAIGIFEVTNAQFKAYEATHAFGAGLDNYPAVVSKEQATGYVAWLSEVTGATYRLPNAKEAADLQQKAHKAAATENTLNYWAGYAITLDEVPMIQAKIKEVATTLLKKVGKNKPVSVGDAKVYDLGGNVAEYAQEGTYGYSAYDFYDAHESTPVKSAYVGIRVIKE